MKPSDKPSASNAVPGTVPQPERGASHLPTTGLPALDAVLAGLRPGDNVVWQV